jgi:uncharacterized membrane protein
MTRARLWSRWLLALLYAVAGGFHLAAPHPFVMITPHWVPMPGAVVALTGVAEIAGAAALLQNRWPRLRSAAGWGLAAYALCVWPANFNHMAIDMARADDGLGLRYHLPRLVAQPLLIWLALWASKAIDWPLSKRA